MGKGQRGPPHGGKGPAKPQTRHFMGHELLAWGGNWLCRLLRRVNCSRWQNQPFLPCISLTSTCSSSSHPSLAEGIFGAKVFSTPK